MNKTNAINCATDGYEAQQWRRDILNTAEDRCGVLFSNFFTSISNAFEKQHKKPKAQEDIWQPPARFDSMLGNLILSNHESREDEGGPA